MPEHRPAHIKNNKDCILNQQESICDHLFFSFIFMRSLFEVHLAFEVKLQAHSFREVVINIKVEGIK